MFILDIEASGLGDDSYPIEIAWCDLEGKQSCSMIINPDSAGGWDHWDSYAESAIHGLSRKQCCEEGESVVTVVRLVERLLKRSQVFSDAPWQDQAWLERLFEAVGRKPLSRLMPLDQAVPQEKRFDLAVKLALPARPHRALADCQLLARIVNEVRSGA